METFEVPPELLATALLDKNFQIIDVRTPEEFWGPEGHIEDACLVPMGDPLFHFLETASPERPYVFVCAHGKRSSQAAAIAQTKGFSTVLSLQGGLWAWRNAKLPLVMENEKKACTSLSPAQKGE